MTVKHNQKSTRLKNQKDFILSFFFLIFKNVSMFILNSNKCLHVYTIKID